MGFLKRLFSRKKPPSPLSKRKPLCNPRRYLLPEREEDFERVYASMILLFERYPLAIKENWEAFRASYIEIMMRDRDKKW